MRNELLVLKNDASQFESQIQTYPIIRFHQDRTVNLAVTMPRLHEWPKILGPQCTTRVCLGDGWILLLGLNPKGRRHTVGLRMKRGTICMAMTGRGRKGRESGRGTEKY
jgi:hypothetical protein